MMRTVIAVLTVLGAACVAGGQAPASRPADARQWAVTIRDPYLAGIGADDVWAAAKSVGISRLEVVLNEKLACPNLFEKGASPYRIDTAENRETLSKRLQEKGVSIGCFAMVIKLAKPGDEDEALDWVVRAAVAAPGVGCHLLMLPIGITGPNGERIGDEEFITIAKGFMGKLDRISARTGMPLAIENLGVYWNRPEILEPVLRVSKPDRVGLLNDICNMYWYGHPLDRLYSLAEQFAPYVRCVHVKSVKYPTEKVNQQRTPGWEYGKYTEPVRTGDIDFARILAIYARAGYIGDVCIEDDSLARLDTPEKKKAVIADDVALLRELIEKLPKGK